MSKVLTQYRELEEAALTSPPETFASDHDYGPHCRLVSAFAWHPWLNKATTLPPMAMLVSLWVATAIARARYSIPQPWGDEAFTWRIAESNWTGMLSALAHDLHPPLYFALVKGLMALGFDSTLSQRTFWILITAGLLGSVPLLLCHWPSHWRRLGMATGLFLCLAPMGLYLVMLRYYGLLAVCVTYGLVSLGNSLLPEESVHARRWILFSAICMALGALTNYQVYLVWFIGLGIATWLLNRDRRRAGWMLGVHGLAMTTAALLTTGIYAVRTGGDLSRQLSDAMASPFQSGVVSLTADVVARLGLLVMTFFHSEFVPLWWPPLFLVLVFAIYRLTPRFHQLPVSLTAKLLLLTAAISALMLVFLTATVIPVGVEFLPARLCFLFPLFAIGGAEWLLKRIAHLRGIAILALANIFVVGWGMGQVTIAIHEPAPTITAPFVHATYLTPTPAINRILQREADLSRTPVIVVGDPTAEFALRQGIESPSGITFIQMLDYNPMFSPSPQQCLRTAGVVEGQVLWVFESTRDLAPRAESYAWNAYLMANASLIERWEFLPEDPLWLALKRAGLRREVAPYKRQLSLYRVDSDAPLPD